MAQTLITQLQERYPSLLKVYSFDEMFAEELRDTGLSPDGILSGTTEQLWLETPPPVQTTQTVRYVSGTVPGLNPEGRASQGRLAGRATDLALRLNDR